MTPLPLAEWKKINFLKTQLIFIINVLPGCLTLTNKMDLGWFHIYFRWFHIKFYRDKKVACKENRFFLMFAIRWFHGHVTLNP